ncbi:MAG TPA: hypothetical protein VMT89_06680 [Candidatus Acidoferrales bacterium]|nr:hypothetical protein [Candidatus Acidoferrales bacterium]
MKQHGYVTLGLWNGVAVRVHWTAPLVALFSAAPRGLHLAPGAWIAFAVVILVHQLGHVFAIRVCGGSIRSVNATCFGGECSWSGVVNHQQRAAIALGGIVAQVALLTLAGPTLGLDGPIKGSFSGDFIYVLTVTNAFIAVVNLFPMRGLDGVEIWEMLGFRRRAPYGPRRDERLERAPEHPPREWFEAPDDLPPLPREVQDQINRIIKESGGPREKV